MTAPLRVSIGALTTASGACSRHAEGTGCVLRVPDGSCDCSAFMFPPGMCRLLITVQSPPAIVVVLFDPARDILECSRPVLAPKSAPEPPRNSPCAARMTVMSDHSGVHMGPSTRSVTELDTELEYRNDDGRPDSGAFRHADSRRIQPRRAQLGGAPRATAAINRAAAQERRRGLPNALPRSVPSGNGARVG